QPAVAAASFILAVAALGDNAFEPGLARRFEHLLAVDLEVIGASDAVGVGDDLPEELLALLERDAAEIVSVEIQQIEEKQRRRGRAGEVRDAIGVGNADARLDEVEGGAAFIVEHGDLAVENRGGSVDVVRQDAQLGILLLGAVSGTRKDAKLLV